MIVLWDAKAARVTFTVLIVAALLYGVYVIRRTLFIFLLAVFFAYMVHPLVLLLDRFRPRRAPSWASPVAALVLVLTFAVLVGTLIGPSIGDEANRLGDQLPALLQRGNAIATDRWPRFLQPYAERIVAFLQAELLGGAAEALPLARRIGTGVLQVASDLLLVVLVPILSFLFILSGPRIRDALERIFARQPVAQRIVDDLDHLFGRYIRALLLLSVAALAAYALFLGSMGVPYALLLAAVAALLEFIPVFGPLLATLIIVIVGVAQVVGGRSAKGFGDGVTTILIGAWCYVAANHVYGFTWATSWPLALVAAGTGMVVRSIAASFMRPSDRHPAGCRCTECCGEVKIDA